jgi:hypothetical protein
MIAIWEGEATAHSGGDVWFLQRREGLAKVVGKGGGEDATIGTRIRTPRDQLVATHIVVIVFNDNVGGGDVVVLMVGCLVEFVKGFCNLENIEVYLVLLLSVRKKCM